MVTESESSTRRTPGQAFRDLSRAIQSGLDTAAQRTRSSSPSGRALHALAASWTTIWWIGVTALAACTAWLAALLVGLPSPVPAAVGALLSVALSFNRSLRSGLSLVSATAVAMVIAYVLYQFWGLHIWTVGVLVASSLVIGRVMRLGPEGSLQIPATALFVYIMGESLTDELIVQRTVATLLGVAIGIVFSFVAHPERPEERLTDTLSDIGRRLGDLLVDMGSVDPEHCTRREAADWLSRSRRLAVELRTVGKELDDLKLGRRFAVGSERAIGQALRDQYELLRQTCQHVNDIARGLFDATSRGGIPLPESLGAMLSSTGEALSVHAEALPRVMSEGDQPTGVLQALESIEIDRQRSIESIKALDDTGALLLGGAILTEVDRMVDRLATPPASYADAPRG